MLPCIYRHQHIPNYPLQFEFHRNSYICMFYANGRRCMHTPHIYILSRYMRHVLGVDKVTTSCGPQFQFKSIRHLIEIAVPSACTLPGMFVDCGTFTQMYCTSWYKFAIHSMRMLLYWSISVYIHTRSRYHTPGYS